MIKILFTGGGTGGHILPIIAIIREIRRIYPVPLEKSEEDFRFFYLGPEDEFGSILLSQEGIKVKHIFAGKIRRYGGFKSFFQNFIDIFFKIPLGTLQALFYIFFLSPDLIFSKGGFGSIPGVLAGKILLTPVFLHEGDIVPGMANRFLSRFALEIFVSFPKTEYFPLKKILLTGNPVRRELLEGSKEEARGSLRLNKEKPVVLILGGSQGAQRINDKILEILPSLLLNFEVIHQCGEKNFSQVKAEARVMMNKEKTLENSYHLFPFLREPELREAYATADVIISRAGSGSIFEISATGKPSILIPLPESAQNHQIKNAYAYQEAGGCLVIEEANFSSRFFLERLKTLVSNPDEYNRMSKSAKDFSKPEAGKIIANYIVSYLTK